MRFLSLKLYTKLQKNLVFHTLNHTPLLSVTDVIIGQDQRVRRDTKTVFYGIKGRPWTDLGQSRRLSVFVTRVENVKDFGKKIT